MTGEKLEQQFRTLATRLLVDVLDQHRGGDEAGALERVDRFGAFVADELAARRRAEVPPPASAGGMSVAVPDDLCGNCGHSRELHRPGCHYNRPHAEHGACKVSCQSFSEQSAPDYDEPPRSAP